MTSKFQESAQLVQEQRHEIDHTRSILSSLKEKEKELHEQLLSNRADKAVAEEEILHLQRRYDSLTNLLHERRSTATELRKQLDSERAIGIELKNTLEACALQSQASFKTLEGVKRFQTQYQKM